jgi:hypothetical protein
MNPCGQRNFIRYAAQAALWGNISTKLRYVLG